MEIAEFISRKSIARKLPNPHAGHCRIDLPEFDESTSRKLAEHISGPLPSVKQGSDRVRTRDVHVHNYLDLHKSVRNYKVKDFR